MDLFCGEFSPCFSDFTGRPSTTDRRCRYSASISLTLIRPSHLHYSLQGASTPVTALTCCAHVPYMIHFWRVDTLFSTLAMPIPW